MTHSCNCMYGTQDSRCCINRARRQELQDAWQRGREGKPLDAAPETAAHPKAWSMATLPPKPVEDWHGQATTNT